MKIIGWQLVRLALEARATLVGTVVESVHRHRGLDRLMILLGSRRGTFYLMLGVRGPGAAFFWTDRDDAIFGFEDYDKTETFNRLRGTRLTDLSVPGADRLLHFSWTGSNRTDQARHAGYSLLASWTGAAGNIWLVDPTDQTIMQSWYPSDRASKERSSSQPSRGTRFVPPPPPALPDWRTLTFDRYAALRRENPSAPLSEFLARHIWGIDAALAGQIAARYASGRKAPEADADLRYEGQDHQEFAALVEATRAILDPATRFVIAGDSNSRRVEVEFPEAPPDESPNAGSLAEMLAAHDQALNDRGSQSRRVELLRRDIAHEMRRRQARIAVLERAIRDEEEARRLQHQADMLGANRHLLRKGMSRVTLTELDGSASLVVTIDPAHTPQQNIDAIYRRARKAITVARSARAELPAATTERERWETAARRLDDPGITAAQVELVRRELGLSEQRAPGERPKPVRRLPYREFMLGTHRVWVGRSSRDNDELTRHFARPGDLFLHAEGTPGSHVILKRPDNRSEFDQTTVARAAQIAAYFSSAKHSGVVPVVYADVKYVRKPRKAPPGLVRLEREESLLVQPLAPPGYHQTPGPEQ